MPETTIDLSVFLPRIREEIQLAFKKAGRITPDAGEKEASEFLDINRIREQYDLLTPYTQGLAGKTILEIGSGFGLFTAYGNKYLNCVVRGLEPAGGNYGMTFGVSRDLLTLMGLDPGLVVDGRGEAIPFADNSFDVVYSSNTLEHVDDPDLTVKECLRVLKPGGIFQSVVPNYGSFWEGHYCIPWIPYLSPSLAPFYVRLFGRSPEFLKEIRFVNYFSLKKTLKPYVQKREIEILTWGEKIFRQRMLTMNFSAWAGLSIVKKWVEMAHRFKLIGFLTQLMILSKSHTPIVLTLRKNP